MRECCTTGSIQRDEGSEGLHWLFTNFIGNFRIDKKISNTSTIERTGTT